MNEKKKGEKLLDDMQSLLGCFFSDPFFSQSTIFIWTDFNFQGTH